MISLVFTVSLVEVFFFSEAMAADDDWIQTCRDNVGSCEEAVANATALLKFTRQVLAASKRELSQAMESQGSQGGGRSSTAGASRGARARSRSPARVTRQLAREFCSAAEVVFDEVKRWVRPGGAHAYLWLCNINNDRGPDLQEFRVGGDKSLRRLYWKLMEDPRTDELLILDGTADDVQNIKVQPVPGAQL